MRKCPKCNTEKSVDEFYSRRGKEGKSVYCKSCTNQQALSRQREFKLLCVEYKGGKCIQCGYNRCVAALEFHHRNPNEKSFHLSQIRFTRFDHRAKTELDKCDLLCANCHRETESIRPGGSRTHISTH